MFGEADYITVVRHVPEAKLFMLIWLKPGTPHLILIWLLKRPDHGRETE